MKKIILLLLITLSINPLNAQINVRDSLKQLLQKETKDTSRVLLLSGLSFAYFESKPDTAMLLAIEALALSRSIGFAKGEAASLNAVGNAYYGNDPKAMEFYLQALKLNEKIDNTKGVQSNLNNLGLIYFQQADYRQALDYFLRSRDLAEKLSNKRSLSITSINIGETYFRLKIFDSARLCTQQAYDFAYEVNYPRLMGSALSVMGEIHFESGHNTLSLDYYRLSIPYIKKSENDLRLSKTFLGMAKVFENNNQIDSVLYYAKHSLSIAEEKEFTLEARDAGRFLTTFYRGRKMADSALFYVDITKKANDSLFNQQKIKQFQSLAFDEKIRQQEIAITQLKAIEERKHNLQYAAIAIALITFIILFFALSRSIIVRKKFIEFFAILGLLAVFEFINLFIHPYLVTITKNSPVLMLVMLIAIGAMLIPLHHKLQKWITGVMVEKNKKIRLAAAKRTIANLEPTYAVASANKGETTN